MISSQKNSFLKAYKEGKNFIPIVETWPADLETPLSTWLKLSFFELIILSMSTQIIIIFFFYINFKEVNQKYS
jgi:hypothetical protein